LAIAVGAFTLTLSLAAGEGARQYADKLIHSNVDPQSLYIVKDAALTGEDGGLAGGLKEYDQNQTQYGGATFKALSAHDIEMIRHTEGIASVQPTYVVQAEYITFEGESKKYTADVSVYDPNILPEVAAGSLPSRGMQINDGDIVIPESYTETLGVKNLHDFIGKKVTLHLQKPAPTPSEAEIQQAFQKGGFDEVQKLSRGESRDVTFTVRAVSAKSTTSFSAATGLFISENQSRDLSEFLTKGTSQYQKYISASAKVSDGLNPETVKEKINKNDIKARTAKDLQSLLFTIVNTLQGIVLGFGVIALIASVFGIINTQYISVLERTSEIGLMKALGMRRRHVSRLFQVEAAWIGLLGGVIGATLAVSAGTALNPWITKTLSLGDDTSLLIFQPLPIFLLLVSLMLIAMLAGYFPSRKAAKLDPIEALRTE
jgi:putative ABC transport system permease protein